MPNFDFKVPGIHIQYTNQTTISTDAAFDRDFDRGSAFPRQGRAFGSDQWWQDALGPQWPGHASSMPRAEQPIPTPEPAVVHEPRPAQYTSTDTRQSEPLQSVSAKPDTHSSPPSHPPNNAYAQSSPAEPPDIEHGLSATLEKDDAVPPPYNAGDALRYAVHTMMSLAPDRRKQDPTRPSSAQRHSTVYVRPVRPPPGDQWWWWIVIIPGFFIGFIQLIVVLVWLVFIAIICTPCMCFMGYSMRGTR